MDVLSLMFRRWAGGLLLLVLCLAAAPGLGQPGIGDANNGMTLETLKVRIRDTNPDTRIVAARRLQVCGFPGAADVLIQSMNDTEPTVRQAIARAISMMCRPALADQLTPVLAHPDNAVQLAAVKALRNPNAATATPLLPLAQDKNATIRAGAICLLGCIHNKETASPIVAALEDADTTVRAVAVQAYQAYGNDLPRMGMSDRDDQELLAKVAAYRRDILWDNTCPVLRAQLKSPDATLRARAAITLAVLRDIPSYSALVDALGHPDAGIRQDAARALTSLNWSITDFTLHNIPNIIPRLIKGVQAEDNPAIRLALIEMLIILCDRRAMPQLIPLLQHPDSNVRKRVIYYLGILGDRRALEPLLALKETDPQMRVTILQILLSKFPEPRILPLILAGLKDKDVNNLLREYIQNNYLKDTRLVAALGSAVKEPDPFTQMILLYGLEFSETPRAIPFIIEALRDPNADVRYTAAVACEYLRDVRVRKPLQTVMLTDIEDRVRMGAAKALAVNCADAPEFLIPLMGFPDNFVRAAAISNARFTRDPHVTEMLLTKLNDADPLVRGRAVDALIRHNHPRVYEVIGTELSRANGHHKNYFLDALCDAQDTRLVDPLITQLAEKDGNILGTAVLRLLEQAKDPKITQAMLALLVRNEQEAHRYAVYALGRLADPGTVDALAGLLDDPDEQTRLKVFLALGQIDSPRAVQLLVERLKKTAKPENIAVLANIYTSRLGMSFISGGQDIIVIKEGLMSSGRRAVEPLCALLQDENPTIRAAAVCVLMHLRDGKALPALEKALRDPDDTVRRYAARGLRRLADARSVTPLLETLRDTSPAVRAEVVLALGAIRLPSTIPTVIDRLLDEHPDVRYAAAWALEQQPDARAVPALIRMINLPGDHDARKQAMRALARIKDALVSKTLISLLKDEDVGIREEAADLLGGLKDQEAVEPLIAVLKDSGNYWYTIKSYARDNGLLKGIRNLGVIEYNWSVFAPNPVMAAVKALGAIGDKRALEPLLVLAKDPNYLDNPALATALAQFNDPRTAAFLISQLPDQNLIQALKDPFPPAEGTVRFAAVESMLKLLGDADTDMRVHAARFFHLAAEQTPPVKEKRAVDPLIALLADEDKYVRLQALPALGAIGEKRSSAKLLTLLQDKDPDIRTAAAEALAELNDAGTIDGLLALLRSKRSTERMLAAELLGKLHVARVADALAGALLDENPDVRWRAAEGLAGLGDQRAAATLFNTLKGNETPDTLVRVIAALAVLQPAKAVEAIIPLLQHADDRVVTAVLTALWLLDDPAATRALLPLLQNQEIGGKPRALDVLCDLARERPLPKKVSDPRVLDALISIARAPSFAGWKRKTTYDSLQVGTPERELAAEILGKSRDKRALDALAGLRDHGSSELRRIISEALAVQK